MKHNKGFTLIEVLVSLLILAVGLMFLVQIMSQAVRLNQRSRNLTLAGFLAQEKMEEIFRDGYGVFKEGKNLEEGKGEGVYSRFRWQQQIVALSPEEAGLKETRVTVFWEERRVDRQIEFISYIRQPLITGGEIINER